MTVTEYLQELDETISSAPEVIQVNVLRRSVLDTGMEIVAVYRYKLTMSNGSLLELTERLVEESGRISHTKYRFHWQNRKAELIKRWDNAPHHPEFESFPLEGDDSRVIVDRAEPFLRDCYLTNLSPDRTEDCCFDLIDDPCETHSIIAQQPEFCDRVREQLLAFMHSARQSHRGDEYTEPYTPITPFQEPGGWFVPA